MYNYKFYSECGEVLLLCKFILQIVSIPIFLIFLEYAYRTVN